VTSFTDDTAAKAGVDPRTVRRDVRRAKKIAPDVLDRIEGTRHDKGTVLDRLAKAAPGRFTWNLRRCQKAPGAGTRRTVSPRLTRESSRAQHRPRR
jgi:hypothetical protein